MVEDIFEGFQSFLDSKDSHLQCTICQEVFVKSITINCGHTYCRYCIKTWKKKNKTCPVCRSDIKIQIPTRDLDNFISRFIDKFMSEEFKNDRKELLKD